jgi:hypothetical protein
LPSHNYQYRHNDHQYFLLKELHGGKLERYVPNIIPSIMHSIEHKVISY